ncbi:biotin--[acetyl-CoA-carboxylase] ligase [uncultured Erythrobacter sp.]|uniref:biotin--[acetyl-CoA-carboxylase] ligase n=1 Tax=uncultured Erythrobacter sp. TaxID=263913 RepID=UPI002628BCBD|nr:biotin--[acetyl-CoA-carboxylase] ligase [uncultured Erythrobacter sp.]
MIGTSTITLVEETGSTNADLAAALRGDEKPVEGTWLVTRRQNAGKGRQGRAWQDGAGNFMGSTVVEIRKGDPAPASLGFVAALAVGQTVNEALGGACRPTLKWPNDVLLAGHKVSGILLEMVGNHIVVGIGVNLVSAPDLPDRKAASLADYDAVTKLEHFAEALSRVFAKYLGVWRSEGLDKILQAFLHNSNHYTGSPVTVHDTDGSKLEGTFAALETSDGALRLRLADGSERVIRAGDIS